MATTDGGIDQLNVKRAKYPIQRPLTLLLKAAILEEQPAETEAPEDALAQLIGNAFEAMDSMYFATPAQKRKHAAFSHRLCVRVTTDDRTLSITDMGAGMTRADLINALGMGRVSIGAFRASKQLSTGGDTLTNAYADADADDEEEREGEETDDQDDPADQEDDDDEDEEEDEENEIEGDEEETKDESTNDGILPCMASDIGGFYSSLCALGKGISIGTKSKFDDYYEFEVGHALNSQSDFTDFSISRPMEEGSIPTAHNGYDKFQDVRGESGTRVTIVLKDSLVDAGWLDHDKLRPILTKVFETSQYTVAFSSDNDACDIIEASNKEDDELRVLETDDSEAIVEEPGASNGDENGHSRVGSHNTVKERAKYIPLRLSLGERKMLRLVEAAMTCSEYTTEVDRPFKNDARRTHEQLKCVTAVLRGLVAACDYTAGQKLLDDDNFVEYEKFFRQMFEIARRHKIMNPEKMRTEYGKLTYLLQDAVSPTVQPHLSFSCKGPIETVYKFLEERGGLAVLDDKLIEVATEEILAGKKSRVQIATEIKSKERAVAVIKTKYRTTKLSSEDIHLCLYSICDNNSFLNSNRVPIDKIIGFLKTYFAPEKIQDGYSLSIVSGEDGARLSHSHERQYFFALQSLTLWRDIIDDMFRLWHMAEEDLLSETVTYSLQDTGQGFQRVQQCPRTYKAMQQILARVQSKVSVWVGSSVIHMGDHNVPNSLSFIDKYTQVPRILGPIVSCLENLERICKDDDGIKDMVESGYGGMEKLRKDILHDFFKSAFDGSGADNFYDAGSCIDGRLTSAWNWCSQLSSKPYYPIFKLTGFIGFDGDFK